MNYKTLATSIVFCFVLLLQPWLGHAQEHTAPLRGNLISNTTVSENVARKTTALALPFFDDFSGNLGRTDPTKWVENQVYINNTLAISPKGLGVATFDALNQYGLPWDPINNNNHIASDSLTSQPIDLSGYNPGDSLYLSFFYQPQGNGYQPSNPDSFLLFMKIRYGNWLPVWRTRGAAFHPFRQALIPITDTLYFHNTFQFRFVNIAALNYADAHWHLDYVKLNSNRNANDTLLQDVGFNSNPSSFLNDYTSMPYRQFMANPTGERARVIVDSIHNMATSADRVNMVYTARELSTGTTLQTPVIRAVDVPGQSVHAKSDTNFTTTVPLTGIYNKVTYRTECYIESTATTGPKSNDTCRQDQIFDNYLAYDDGSPEQSYYLTLYPSLPGKIAVEQHLNTQDTLRGMAIYFGRQAPSAIYKTFTINIWKDIAGINGATADNLVYQSALYSPGYVDTINHFWIYTFDSGIAMGPGTFYSGIFLPAESGNDSLYFGLDVNRRGGNHTYYNVLSSWNPSGIRGALMMRPLLGQHVTPSQLPIVTNTKEKQVFIYPNPAQNTLNIQSKLEHGTLTLCNIYGQRIITTELVENKTLDISHLPSGVYMAIISENNNFISSERIIISH